VESLRHNAAVHDVDPLSEVEYRSASASAETLPETLEPNTLATLELIWDQRKLLYKVALWALIVSTTLVFLIPKQYESTVSIMPPEPSNDAGTMISALLGKATGVGGSGLSMMAGGLLGVKSSGALFVEVLRSRTVQDHIVDRLSLQQVYWERYKEEARKKLNRKTDISEDRKSGVIHITVTDRSPARARDIGRGYVEELDRLVAQVSTSSARRQRFFIEGRLAAVKQDLEDAEQQFSAFASKNTTLDIKEQTKAMVEAGAVLQGQLIAAQSELQSLEQIYTGNNVRVRALRARVDELSRQLQKMGGSDASLNTAAPSDELYPSIRKLPLLGVQWADLYRRVKIQETVYELLTQQYELARIQEAKEIPSVNVIDPANLPEKKSWPPRMPIVVVFTLLSLAVAMLLIVESARLQSLDDDDVRKQLAVAATQQLRHLRTQVAKARLFARFTTSADRTDRPSS
jgi:capsule polysaccharide export protein KpsE/RkpR